jgi:predicted O-methyltransferase YrrM
MTTWIDSHRAMLSNIKGFLDHQEGLALHQMAVQASQQGPCLEVGSYCGRSTVYIGAACRENNAILYSIDHHRGSEEQQPGEDYFDPDLFDFETFQIDTFKNFRQTLSHAELEETVVPLVCRSDVAARFWTTQLALVFIDGGHAAKTVQLDYQCWAQHVMPGGYLIFHDIFPNPADGGQAPYEVYQSALATGKFIEKPMIKSLGILRKKE